MSPFSLDKTQYLMCRGDYMTRPQEDNKAGPSKKQYAMTHDAGGVTVSEKVCFGPELATGLKMLAGAVLDTLACY